MYVLTFKNCPQKRDQSVALLIDMVISVCLHVDILSFLAPKPEADIR